MWTVSTGRPPGGRMRPSPSFLSVSFRFRRRSAPRRYGWLNAMPAATDRSNGRPQTSRISSILSDVGQPRGLRPEIPFRYLRCSGGAQSRRRARLSVAWVCGCRIGTVLRGRCKMPATGSAPAKFSVPDPSSASRHDAAPLLANTAWYVMPASQAKALGLTSYLRRSEPTGKVRRLYSGVCHRWVRRRRTDRDGERHAVVCQGGETHCDTRRPGGASSAFD